MTRCTDADQDLLLGMLALKRGLIDHVQLLEAFEAWNAAENRSMAEILVEQGGLEKSDISRVVSELADPAYGNAARTVEPDRSATVAYFGTDPELRAS